jgi:hypothetical protein
MLFIDPMSRSLFWGDMFVRFGIAADLEKMIPGNDKMFKASKVLYQSYVTSFFREYKFLIGTDYIMIYSQLMVEDRDGKLIEVMIPLKEKRKPLEAWKMYFPFCVEMLIWIFEFYQDFDQRSWEIPLETMGSNNQYPVLPGFIKQVIGHKGNIRGVSITKEDVSKRLKESFVWIVVIRLQFLESSDNVILLNEGEIVSQGRYEELKEKGYD